MLTSNLIGRQPTPRHDGSVKRSSGQQLTVKMGDTPTELITIGRALGMLSGITRTLDPDLDPFAIATRRARSRRGSRTHPPPGQLAVGLT